MTIDGIVLDQTGSERGTARISIVHALRALRAVVMREIVKFIHQVGRLASALVRPGLWLVVFAAGFQKVLGVSIVPPYETYVEYQEYMVPGLIGMVILFNGMQSSLSLVYDREIGVMRLLLTTPLPRWYLLFCKLLAGTILSIIQAYAFLFVAFLVGVEVPWSGWLYMLPMMFVTGMMLGSIGLLLSVYIKQLENFAGAMNFVIFPMYFLSTALYPLWKLREAGAESLYWVAQLNPFTYGVEVIRFAAYGKLAGLLDSIAPGGESRNTHEGVALLIVIVVAAVAFLIAVNGYDPQRGFIRKRQQAST